MPWGPWFALPSQYSASHCLLPGWLFQISSFTSDGATSGGLPWPDMERNIYLICYSLAFFLVLLKIWSCFGCLLIICYSTHKFNLLQGRDLMCLIHPLPSAVPGRQHTYFFPKTFWLHHTTYNPSSSTSDQTSPLRWSSESQWLDHQGGSTAGS